MKKHSFRDVKIELLREAAWNYKIDDDTMLSKLINNLERNGVVQNLLVRKIKGSELYEVVNGNHRLKALKTLGWDTVFVCDLGEMSDEDAYRMAIETNETRFEHDFFKLSDLTKGMVDHFGLEELRKTLPFGDETLAQMLAENKLTFDDNEDMVSTTSQAETVNVKVPKILAEGLNKQLKRYKRVSDGRAWEAVLAVLMVVDDHEIEDALSGSPETPNLV